MEREQVLQTLKQYNKGLVKHSCTPLEKAYVSYIDEANYFYSFNFVLNITKHSVEEFIKEQKQFKGLLKEHGEELCNYLRMLPAFTCNTRTIRMDVRSNDFSNYDDRIMSAIVSFYLFYGLNLNLKSLIYGEYRQMDTFGQDFSCVIANELQKDNVEVIQYCKDVLVSEQNTAILTKDVIVAIEKSNHVELQDLLTKLLLAASLQEGVRQSILESVDEYQFSYFMHMLDVIAEHNLLRFSSVKRAVLTWIGIGYDIVEQKQIMQIFQQIYTCFHDEPARQKALQGENPLYMYIAFYCKGATQLEQAIEEATQILTKGTRVQVACAIVYLKMTLHFDVIKYKHFLKTYKEDEWIVALYVSECLYKNFEHDTKEDTADIFHALVAFVDKMDKHTQYTSKGFSWMSISLDRTSVCRVLFTLLKKQEKEEEILCVLPYVATCLYGESLETFIRQTLKKISIPAQKEFLLNNITSSNQQFRILLVEAYKTLSLEETDILQLEEKLKTKKASARASIVQVLASQKDAVIIQSVARLQTSSMKYIQESACELKQKAPQLYKQEIEEKIQILGTEDGFGLYHPTKTFTLQAPRVLKVEKKSLFRKVTHNVDTLFPWNKKQVLSYLALWNERIIMHEQDEYYNGSTYHQVKERHFFPIDYNKKSLDALALNEIWRAYFEEDQLQDDIRFELDFLLGSLYDDVKLESMLRLDCALFTICELDCKQFQYLETLRTIFRYYFYEYSDENKLAKAAILWELFVYDCKDDHYKVQDYQGRFHMESLTSLVSVTTISNMFDLLQCDDSTFKKYFPIYYQAYGKFHIACNSSVQNKFTIQPLVLARAVVLDCLEEESLMEQILDTHEEKKENYYYHLEGNLFECYRDAYFEGRGIIGKPHFNLDTYTSKTSSDVISYLREVLDKISKKLINMESCRLNDVTAITKHVQSLTIVRGVHTLIQALHVLEDCDLKRSEYGDDRATVFTNIIRRCYPYENEDFEKLKQAAFSQERLVEVAMLAPQWIDIINEILCWDGFKDACYYFIAHMKSYDINQKKAEIAHYTDIEPSDLNDGAFDMAWCKQIAHQLGKKRFKMIYQAAKFLCDNAFHTRARKYADACLNIVKKEEFLQQAKDKRNKDALNAYVICPIENDEDLLNRYLYIQAFQKESKKFGSQRQASEKRACDIAMVNLARNSRYESVTRLSWRMESESIQKNKRVLSPQSMDIYNVWIEIDEQGHNEIQYEKQGKRIKNTPSSLKRHEAFLELKDIHNQWNEQYRRSRAMLQQAMEDQSQFDKDEIVCMMNNPIVSPMLQRLLLITHHHIGYVKGDKLNTLDGEIPLQEPIRIAHAYDLYKSGQWKAYQKQLFKDKMVQPFKQVFRELYVKLDDELDQSMSNRYSGYQIQPSKAAAALKSRKWNVSYEAGLERIYYKENLIVNLYANADWFSPSDVEAPSIDYVCFYDRNGLKKITIKELSDITFSEIMRDIDMAVSVAYVGGVDPTTSFSTMELRKSIVQYTCELLGLHNVMIQDHFVNIEGTLNDYSIHLGSGMVHQSQAGAIHIVSVHSGQRGKVFLPFLDEDPKTAEIISKVVLFAKDTSIKDVSILSQITTTKA